mgnify:FL=1
MRDWDAHDRAVGARVRILVGEASQTLLIRISFLEDLTSLEQLRSSTAAGAPCASAKRATKVARRTWSFMFPDQWDWWNCVC